MFFTFLILVRTCNHTLCTSF